VRLPLPHVVIYQTDLPKGYHSTLTLTGLTLAGLDTLSELVLLEPVPGLNLTLRTTAALQSLTIELELEVLIIPAHLTGTQASEHTYQEELLVTVSMHNVSFLLDLDIALNSSLLDSYYLDQLSTPPCWLSALQSVSISDLTLLTNITTLKAVQVVGDAGVLEKDIVGLLDNALLLLISPRGFGDLTSGLIEGLLQGPVRASFNRIANETISMFKKTTPCLPHYPYNDAHDFITWSNSTLITALDLIIKTLSPQVGVICHCHRIT
jgi:hypothetical protein